MGELTKIWFTELLEREIEEVNGTISNNCLWLHSSKTEEEAEMFSANIASQEEYKQFLLNLKSQVEKGDTVNV